MNQSSTVSTGRSTIQLNRIKTYFSKPHNVILLIMGIVLTVTTVAPIVAIVQDTFKIHAGTIDAHLTGQASGYTLVNYIDLFTSRLAMSNLWMPLINTVLLAVGTCVVAIVFGGLFAFLITRTNLSCRKYLSSIFIFPYIMPQWTLAVVWQNLFNSNAVTGTSNGLLAATLGVQMPLWWCKGLFPSLVVLGLHYAPFAYILIGGIFRNMDANLEEAATILDTPKWKTMFKITLPMVKPAILSTILLVFGSSMGSYPVPHYLGLTTLATKYPRHHHDDLRRGHHVPESDEPAQPEELHHRHRQVRPDLQDQSGPGGQAHHRRRADRHHLFHQHLPHRLLCI